MAVVRRRGPIAPMAGCGCGPGLGLIPPGAQILMTVPNPNLPGAKPIAPGTPLPGDRCLLPDGTVGEIDWSYESGATGPATIFCMKSGNVVSFPVPAGYQLPPEGIQTYVSPGSIDVTDYSQYGGTVTQSKDAAGGTITTVTPSTSSPTLPIAPSPATQPSATAVTPPVVTAPATTSFTDANGSSSGSGGGGSMPAPASGGDGSSGFTFDATDASGGETPPATVAPSGAGVGAGLLWVLAIAGGVALSVAHARGRRR